MPTVQEEIEREVNEAIERTMRAVIMNLKVIGEKCVNAARQLPSLSRADKAAARPHQPNYIDDTSNLRSSICYVLVVDGQIISESDFAVVGNGQQGSQAGKSFAESLAANYPTGFALIVVAGMHYAEYVAAKGYDVLDTAELLAEQLVQQLMNDIQQQTQ